MPLRSPSAMRSESGFGFCPLGMFDIIPGNERHVPLFSGAFRTWYQTDSIPPKSRKKPEKVGKLLKMPCTHDFSTDQIQEVSGHGLNWGQFWRSHPPIQPQNTWRNKISVFPTIGCALRVAYHFDEKRCLDSRRRSRCVIAAEYVAPKISPAIHACSQRH